ncbi:MAG: hypothetical protein KDE53_00980 [Caldilineaceae bacterium]|nr:hypothetical protein [Caldilineaceae bacterium]
MIVELYDHNRQRIHAPVMAPLRYSASAIGGPQAAMIQVYSDSRDVLRYVGHYVIIRNDSNVAVWWGKVEEVLLNVGKLQIGVSSREMRNRIKVLHTYMDGEGIPTPAETEFAEDARSVAVYGRFEERHSVGDASADQALAVRDQALLDIGLPKASLKLNRTGGSGAILRCVGLWDTLHQTYYENLIGRELFTASHTAEQVMGWALSSDGIGFADKRVQALPGTLDVFNEGDKFTISGSASNNGTKTVFNVAEGKPQDYTNNTIDFDPSDDLNDSANGLGFIRSGNFFLVSGSPLHSRWHLADEVGRGHIATDEAVTGAISAEAAGPFITIQQGQSLEVSESITTEIPGASVTMTAHGSKIAYAITITDSGGWLLGEAWAKLMRVGDGTDSVRIEFCANSGGNPGAVLDATTIPGSAILQQMAWVRFSMNHVVTVQSGQTYWIVISRTGANSHLSFYKIGLDEEVGHSGTLRLWTGTGWAIRGVPASMPFQLWGHRSVTNQITDILASEGQYFSAVSVRYASSIMRRQYRDGAVTAYDELEPLLTAGQRLLPRITPDWGVVVEPVPTGEPRWKIGADGELTNMFGQPVGQGVLPVGEWCAIDGIPDNISAIAPVSPFVIGRLEYNAERNELIDIQALDSTDIWAVGEVRQG